LDRFLTFSFLSGVKLSPKGSSAAFVVQRADEEKTGYTADLWLCDVESGKLRQLTAGGGERSFIWLDEDSLLFPAKRGKQKEEDTPHTDFYRIRTDGGEAVKAFTVPVAVQGIKPLKKGGYLVKGEYDNALPDLNGMDKAGKEAELARRKEDEDYTVLDEIPFWANGEGLINKKRSRLWRFDEKTGAMESLTPPLFNVQVWELDEAGEKVLYSGAEYDGCMPLSQGLYLLDPATGEREELLSPGRYDIHEAWLTGEGVCMLGTEGKRYGLNENPCFYKVEKGEAVLCWDPDISFGSSVGSDCRLGGGRGILWDGDSFVMTVTDRNCSRLARWRPGGTLEFLTEADGSVDCFDSKGGVCVYVAMRGQRLQELYRLDGSETRLSDFNGEALADRYVAVPQPVSFKNRDGVEIDGWVLLPKDYTPKKRYPGILDVHGGPKTVYGTVYYHEMQHWAGKGFFVFFCNPRGGDGRGNAFADIRGKYGTIDYQDLMDFTDEVLRRYPAIDEKRLGVTGGSYGGFMTNWIIGHTERFAAAASQRSISNWVSMGYTTDIGYYFAPDQTGATPWEGVDRMWEQSPLKYADRCKTPTLFIHSNEDYRCWQAEGLQMFTALKRHGVEARLCLFKGENHELSRSGKPKHRIRRLTEITGWMEKHLEK